MDEADIAAIRDAVLIADFAFDQQHIDAHAFTEGFSLPDVITAVVFGDVIEDALPRNRCLFCVAIPSLREDARFRGRWLHACVQRDENAMVTLVTAYRPRISQWRTERERR